MSIRGGQLRRACGLVNKSSRNEAGNIKSNDKLLRIAKGETLAIYIKMRCRLPLIDLKTVFTGAVL